MAHDSSNFRDSFFGGLFRRWQWAKDTTLNRIFQNQIFDSATPELVVNKDDLLTPINDCPHLGLAIAKKCEMFANGEWKCVSVDDDEKEFPDDEGLKLLNKPNPLQSREDFLWQYMFYREGFANNFIYAPRGSVLVKPKTLWHLPSERMKIKLTGKMFDQYELDGIVKYFKLCYGGYEKQYDVKDVIYHATNWSFQDGMGRSKIPGLNYPISNIMASLKTRNIISVKKGMIGILSNEAKDAVGNIPMSDPDRERIEKQFDNDRGLYGGREKIIISQSAVRWNPTSFPVRDLMLHEGDEMDFQTICDSIGIDRRVFSGTKDATYENKKQATIGTYQNDIQPIADSFAGMITAKIADPGRKYILDYSWLPIMGEDELQEAQEEKLETERLSIMLRDGVISHETYAELADVPMTGSKMIQQKPNAMQQPNAQTEA